MDYLILYAHPNEKSFNNAIKEKVKATLSKKGYKYEVRDLYNLNFNPILTEKDFIEIQKGNYLDDVKIEQNLIKNAKNIIVICPIWWYSVPAILKGYIDRVFAYGFAYDFDDKGNIVRLLKNKNVYIINTMGETKQQCEDSGICEALKKTIGGIFEFCGMKVVNHKIFYAVPYVSDEERKNMLKEIENIF